MPFRSIWSVTELVLLSVSTGEHHVSAAQPVIRVTETIPHQGHCSVMLEIVGDRLALLLTYENHPTGLEDTFYLYNWRTGNLITVRTTEYQWFGVLMLGFSVDLLCGRGQISRLHLLNGECHGFPEYP